MEGTPVSEIDWKRQGAFTFFGFAYLVRTRLGNDGTMHQPLDKAE